MRVTRFVLVITIVLHSLSPIFAATRNSQQQSKGRTKGSHGENQPQPTDPDATEKARWAALEAEIYQRDLKTNGIIVTEPKIYDDALLQQMLQSAEAKLV